MRKINFNLKDQTGFTVVEVIVASGIMTILAVGTLSVYSYVVKLNMGNNLRSHALTVLQAEAEWYRSLKFVPGAGLSAVELNGTTAVAPKSRWSGRNGINDSNRIEFTITATIDNDPFTDGIQTGNEDITTFKEIKIVAVPVNPQPGWLADLKTELVIQRVRSNR